MRDFVNKIDEVQRYIRNQGLNYKMADICRLAASMPAPRFYTDVNTAIKQYNLYKQGYSKIHGTEKRKMYAEIFARYEKKLHDVVSSGQLVRKKKLMEETLAESAPSFYYDGNSALKMYYYIMSKRRKARR